MKIRPSLRIYFLSSMLITGIVAISAMSVVSFNFYVAGIDFEMSKAMHNSAYQQAVSNGKPIEINGFTVASRWQDLPVEITEHFDKAELVDNELLKFVDGNPLFAPPKAGYFIMKSNRNDKVRYLSSMFSNDTNLIPISGTDPQILNLFIIAFIAIIFISIIPFVILRKVAIPIEQLIIWAKQLNKKNLSQQVPKFHYSELDKLAGILHSSLSSVQESLEREQKFLAYASHELRTPIAVTRTNTELLQKMMTKEISKEKQLEVLKRIERAGLTMTGLTETLLWLNRRQDKTLPLKNIALGSFINNLVDELSYLLSGKQVEINVQCDDTSLELPEALLRIVISNLIRNAFQHTIEGTVTIVQSQHRLVIENQNSSSQQNKDELGFGLGLELTQRLIKQQGWEYKNKATEKGHYNEIRL